MVRWYDTVVCLPPLPRLYTCWSVTQGVKMSHYSKFEVEPPSGQLLYLMDRLVRVKWRYGEWLGKPLNENFFFLWYSSKRGGRGSRPIQKFWVTFFFALKQSKANKCQCAKRLKTLHYTAVKEPRLATCRNKHWQYWNCGIFSYSPYFHIFTSVAGEIEFTVFGEEQI